MLRNQRGRERKKEKEKRQYVEGKKHTSRLQKKTHQPTAVADNKTLFFSVLKCRKVSMAFYMKRTKHEAGTEI